MSQIYLNPSSLPLVLPSNAPSGMSLIAKAVSALAFFFFAAFLYVTITRKSTFTRPNDQKKDPPLHLVHQVVLEQPDKDRLCYALLEKSGQVPQQYQAEHERLILIFSGDGPVSEEDVAHAEQFLRTMNQRPQSLVEARDAGHRVEVNDPYAPERAIRNQQDEEYALSLRMDEQREVERQREAGMKEAFEPLLRRIQGAKAILDEREVKLQPVDRLCKQYLQQEIVLRTQKAFTDFETRITPEDLQALDEEAPKDQFKGEVKAFDDNFQEEKFEGNRIELRNAYDEYCTSIGTVTNYLEWKNVRKDILSKLLVEDV